MVHFWGEGKNKWDKDSMFIMLDDTMIIHEQFKIFLVLGFTFYQSSNYTETTDPFSKHMNKFHQNLMKLKQTFVCLSWMVIEIHLWCEVGNIDFKI